MDGFTPLSGKKPGDISSEDLAIEWTRSETAGGLSGPGQVNYSAKVDAAVLADILKVVGPNVVDAFGEPLGHMLPI